MHKSMIRVSLTQRLLCWKTDMRDVRWSFRSPDNTPSPPPPGPPVFAKHSSKHSSPPPLLPHQKSLFFCKQGRLYHVLVLLLSVHFFSSMYMWVQLVIWNEYHGFHYSLFKLNSLDEIQCYICIYVSILKIHK